MNNSHSRLRPLGDLVDVHGGGTPSKERPEFWRGTIPWVSPKDMKCWDISDAIDHINEAAIEQSACKLIQSPAVLFVVRGMILAHTLPVAVSRVPVAINQDMKALTPKSGVDAEYLALMLAGAAGILLGRVEIAGHGTRRLATTAWMSLPVRVPNFEEQRRIVARVQDARSKADEIRRLREEATLAADAVEAALVADLLATLPEGTPTAPLGALLSRSQYGTSQKASATGEGVPVYRMGNIQRGRLVHDGMKYVQLSAADVSKYALRRGDILINRTNSLELVGKAACVDTVPANSVFASYLVRLIVDRASAVPDYVSFLINSRIGRAYILRTARRAIGMVNINAEEIAKMPIPVPGVAVQESMVAKFVEVRQACDLLRGELAADEVTALASSILRQAFAGEL